MSDIVGTFRSYALDKDNCPRMDTEVVYVRVGLLMEAADRIERLESALRWVSLQHYTDQRTVTPEIAHQAYRPLIAHVNAICDKARAALGEERT